MLSAAMELPKDRPLVSIHTTQGRGFTPEELAERCADRLVSISDTSHPAIREQAHAFKAQVKAVVQGYIEQAIRSDRTTVYNALNDAGQPGLAELIRRL